MVLNQAADKFEKEHGRRPDTYQDFRRLLEDKDIDAVSIATPNHTHALIGISAVRAGKHVYVEKPVSHNVWEGRQLANAAEKYDRLIQAGTQSRSSTALQLAVKFVQDGELEKILYVTGTCYKARPSIGKLNSPLEIPKHVDYDLWCGPAAKVDLYRPKLHYDLHCDYNTGNDDMGNQGIHQMDIARWFLGESTIAPRTMSVGARVGYEDAGNTANTQIVYHDYATAPIIFETRGLPKSKAAQKNWGASMDRYMGSKVGVVVHCEDGYVFASSSYGKVAAFDNDGNQIKQWSGQDNHFQNFVSALRSGNKSDLNAPIVEGHISSALCHTGNISHQLGKLATAKEIARQVAPNDRLAESFDRMAKHLQANEVDIDRPTLTLGLWVEFDPQTEQAVGNKEVSRLLTRDYRGPFIVPEVSV